jgi:UDP-GlcNAc:undecaprenyl-phosphate/decaprenyl-phosphate GlcNAc-1-phosphate transferase
MSAMMFSAVWFGLSVVACCSPAGPMGRLLGVIDYPDGGRKSHAKPTPMVGGIALMVPLLLIALISTALGYTPVDIYAILMVVGLGFLLLGWYDDRRHAPPSARLVVSSALFGAVVLLQPDLALSRIDLGPGLPAIPLWPLAFPFTVLCLVGLQNSINMVDGMNGLLIGLSLFWSGCLLFYAPDHLQIYLQLLVLGLAILLPYNLLGALFLGDAGSYSIGATIGLLMIYVHNEANGALPMLTVVLWLMVPVVDCLRVMMVRVLHERSPLSPDKNHLHHRLAGHWRWPVCLVIYLALVAGPGLVAALFPNTTLPMLVLNATAYTGLLWVTRAPRMARAQSSPKPI